jgi:hypothetical protein
MKTSILLSVLAVLVIVSGCKVDKYNTIPDPGKDSEFWSSGRRQHALNGNVKTVIEKEYNDHYDNDYNYLEFDDKGNLIINQTRNSDDPDYYYGNTMSYDTKNRLTKIVYGSKTNPEREVAEFTYTDKHNVYIPTNIYSMEDLRLQKGISSVYYKISNKEPMQVNYVAGDANRLTFEGTVGGLADALGEIDKIVIDHKNGFPEYIDFQMRGVSVSKADVKFGNDGMPLEVMYEWSDEIVTTKYAHINGFLLMTGQETKDKDDGDVRSSEYTYNEKGHLIYEKEPSRSEHHYEYEYDSKGNWTKKIAVNADGSNKRELLARTYTYWD